MSIFQDAILRFGRTIMSYAGDAMFLQAAVSAAANVIVADGDVAEEEVEAAIVGIRANPILEKSYDTLRVEQELYEAISRAKTRAGRIENLRAAAAIAERPIEQRQDVFLIAADVDQNSVRRVTDGSGWKPNGKNGETEQELCFLAIIMRVLDVFA